MAGDTDTPPTDTATARAAHANGFQAAAPVAGLSGWENEPLRPVIVDLATPDANEVRVAENHAYLASLSPADRAAYARSGRAARLAAGSSTPPPGAASSTATPTPRQAARRRAPAAARAGSATRRARRRGATRRGAPAGSDAGPAAAPGARLAATVGAAWRRACAALRAAGR